MHRLADSRVRVRGLTIGIAVVALAACSESGARDTGSGNRGSGGPGAPGAGGGGRGPVVTLAESDVATARRSRLEESIPLTGDLRPVEVVDIRARIEGDVFGVYVREGERVRAGQVLARFEASEQESAQQSAVAGRVAAQSALQTAEWNRDQLAELFRAGAAPERDLRAAEQAVAAARAQLAAAQSQVRASSSTVSDTRVIAPISGTVERRQVENGEHVARGATMFTVVRTDALELAASVPARFSAETRPGQLARIVADGRRIDGRVVRVSPTIDPATRAVTVYVQVPNPSGALKGGTFVSGRLVGRSIPDALVIPSAGVRQGEGGRTTYVFRIAGNSVEQTPVQVGVTDDDAALSQILSGLEEGDRVIVGNVGTLGRGMRVQIIGKGDSGAVSRRPASSPPAASPR